MLNLSKFGSIFRMKLEGDLDALSVEIKRLEDVIAATEETRHTDKWQAGWYRHHKERLALAVAVYDQRISG